MVKAFGQIMIKRRTFIKKSAWAVGTTFATTSFLSSCSEPTTTSKETITKVTNTFQDIKISLAQWSLNRAFFANKLNAEEFANIAINDYGINAVEYVNGFYKDKGNDEAFWQQMKERSDKAGVTNLLIMVDEEGDLGNTDAAARKQAVENHYKWVNAAKLLGCHSIRVNAFGEGKQEDIRSALVDGMGQLVAYATKEGINILIENHGLQSSNGKFIAGIMKEVNHPNFGTLPDFGNWCLNEKWGSTQNKKCTESYNIYQGVQDFMPYAKGVSAKSYDFDADGNETQMDYAKFLQIVKEAGYDGYVGIEYEGERLSEPDGIRATKALLEKAWKQVNS